MGSEDEYIKGVGNLVSEGYEFRNKVWNSIPDGQAVRFEDILPFGDRVEVRKALDYLEAQGIISQVGFGWVRVKHTAVASAQPDIPAAPPVSVDPDLSSIELSILVSLCEDHPVPISEHVLQDCLDGGATAALRRLEDLKMAVMIPGTDTPSWSCTEVGKAFAREICGGEIEEDEDQDGEGEDLDDDLLVPLPLALYVARQIDEAFRLAEREVLIRLIEAERFDLAQSYLGCEARTALINTLTGAGDILRVHAGTMGEEEEEEDDDSDDGA